jgi:hypothetical protein
MARYRLQVQAKSAMSPHRLCRPETTIGLQEPGAHNALIVCTFVGLIWKVPSNILVLMDDPKDVDAGTLCGVENNVLRNPQAVEPARTSL